MAKTPRTRARSTLPLTRRSVLHGASALVGVGCSGGGTSQIPPKDTGTPPTADTSTIPVGPANVIYVFVDQLRYDALRCTGNPVGVTPHFDAFATEAASFTSCVTNGPSCRAARGTMITGMHVVDHGVWTNKVTLDPALPSHVRRIRDEAGYHTMVIGKTHLHDGQGHFDDHKPKLEGFGFSDSVELPDPQEWQKQSAHSDWLTATTPSGETDKYERWQDYVRTYTWDSAAPDEAPWFLATEDHLDAFCGRTAAEFVRAWPQEVPLYLQVCFPGPHKPFDPTSEYLALYDVEDPNMPPAILAEPVEPIAPLVASYLSIKTDLWDDAGARRLRAHYYAKVSLVDAAFGELMSALRDTGLTETSWIVVHSDHGELIADHQLTGKVVSYEGAIRVPLLVRPPGGMAGWEDLGQVDQRDVVATIVSLCGLDPAGMGDRVLTERVLGGPTGADAHAHKPVMFENMGVVGIRDGRYKMSWELELGLPVELYDLELDPDELTNQVTDPTARDVLDGLVTTLRSLRVLPVDVWQS